MITIVDVCRDLGVEPTPALTWPVGTAVRQRFEGIYGSLPYKALRGKTYGNGGSHCFAVYPEEFRREIVAIIQMHSVEAERQMDLFA